MRISILFLLSICAIILSCSQDNKKVIPPISQVIVKNDTLSEAERKTWHHKDIIQDTLPGISLERAYKELLGQREGEEIIVAVIDTKLDIHHEDIAQSIWKNPNEIPGNNKDDDNNGYIDDINGWNFLGNASGEDVVYSNYESMRIIRKYESLFKDKPKDSIPTQYLDEYTLYEDAQKWRAIELENGLKNKENSDSAVKLFAETKEALKSFFPKENYTIPKLDSLRVVHRKDSVLGRFIFYMKECIKYNFLDEQMDNYKKTNDLFFETALNFEHDERIVITGDNPEDITDINYGNNKVWNDSIPFQHAIGVAGILAANRKNDKGVNGIYDKIRIMSLCVASSGGDEHDKDIALAIRYATDNGAKIINMSFGKPLSLTKKWVDDAIEYAASKNVLIVCSAGNDNKEVTPQDAHYPSDFDDQEKEIADNLIKVGAITYNMDKNFKASFSNYSKEHVDIFAPGDDMYSTVHGNKYEFSGGTSYSAPVVSGVAALIRSYYPKLSAAEVKDIILQSGVSYNVEVEIEQEDDTKKTLPFSELSKSGKVVNAYNALLMAKKIAKGK